MFTLCSCAISWLQNISRGSRYLCHDYSRVSKTQRRAALAGIALFPQGSTTARQRTAFTCQEAQLLQLQDANFPSHELPPTTSTSSSPPGTTRSSHHLMHPAFSSPSRCKAALVKAAAKLKPRAHIAQLQVPSVTLSFYSALLVLSLRSIMEL